MTKTTSRVLTVTVLAAVMIALMMVVARFQRPPGGPVPIAYDREQCAECRMLVSEPAFAAQIQTRDGRVLDFDDPGCLITYEETQHPDEHAVYFHELRGDRWLPKERTVFVSVDHSPMGYGLGAAEVGTPGAISFEEARARVLARGRGGHAAGPAPGARP